MTADEYLSGDVGGKLEHVRALLDAECGRAERQTREAWNEHLGFSVDADGLPGDARGALAQLRKTHLWESSLDPDDLALRGGRRSALRRPRPRRAPDKLGLLASAHPPRIRGL